MNPVREVRCDYCGGLKRRLGFSTALGLAGALSPPVRMVRRLPNGLLRCAQCTALRAMKALKGEFTTKVLARPRALKSY